MKRINHSLKIKVLFAVCCVVFLFSLLGGCSKQYRHNYDEDWIIGKTPEEVMERYGEFDKCLNDIDPIRGRVGYIIQEERRDKLWGGKKTEAIYFLINFDWDTGIAIGTSVEEGGWGG